MMGLMREHLDNDPYGNQTDKTPKAFDQQRLAEADMVQATIATRDGNLSAAEKDRKERKRIGDLAAQIQISAASAEYISNTSQALKDMFDNPDMRDSDKKDKYEQDREAMILHLMQQDGLSREDAETKVDGELEASGAKQAYEDLLERMDAYQELIAKGAANYLLNTDPESQPSPDKIQESYQEQQAFLNDIKTVIDEHGSSPELKDLLAKQESLIQSYEAFMTSENTLSTAMFDSMDGYFGGKDQFLDAMSEPGSDDDAAVLAGIFEHVAYHETRLLYRRGDFEESGVARASDLDHWDNGLAIGKSTDYYIFEGDFIEEGDGEPYYILHGTNWTAENTSIKITAESHRALFEEISKKHGANEITVLDFEAGQEYANTADQLTHGQAQKTVMEAQQQQKSEPPAEPEEPQNGRMVNEITVEDYVLTLARAPSKLDNPGYKATFAAAAAPPSDGPARDLGHNYSDPNAGR